MNTERERRKAANDRWRAKNSGDPLRRALGKVGPTYVGKKSGGWNEIFESPTWLDGREFKEYALAVALVLVNAKRPLCTREIHAALGDKARPRWTQDALEAVRNLGKVGILPTRYYIIDGPLAQPKKQRPKDDHNRIFQ